MAIKVNKETFEALHLLLRHYRGEIYLEKCSLCAAAGRILGFEPYTCTNCLWTLFGYTGKIEVNTRNIRINNPCVAWLKHFCELRGINQDSLSIGKVRAYPDKYPEIVKVRIEMLTLWSTLVEEE